jgi:hypothetical protein
MCGPGMKLFSVKVTDDDLSHEVMYESTSTPPAGSKTFRSSGAGGWF